MAWTAPLTWAAQNLTAALLNTHLRDNLNETAPGIASASGRLIVTDGANSIVERLPAVNVETALETTTSTSFTDLATVGPAITATTGTSALVMVSAYIKTNDTGENAVMSFAVTGATTSSPNQQFGAFIAGNPLLERSTAIWIATLTAGSNTFTAKYKVSGATGTFDERTIIVIPF